MAAELEREANARFVDEEYEEALNLYSQAIEKDQTQASCYASRAAAHIKLENYTDAIADSNRAIELDPHHGKAYLRKGTACFHLEEYQTAKAALQAGLAIEPNNSTLRTWLRKCEAELADEAAANGEAPAAPMDVRAGEPSAGAPAEEATAPPPPPPPPMYRHEFYQSPTHVTVTVFAKGVKAENLQVEFGEQMLSVIITHAAKEPYYLQQRLYGKISPNESKHVLMSTKVELKLKKVEPIQWTGLGYAARPAVAQPLNYSRDKAAEIKAKYPSSKKRPDPVDWDKLEAEIKKEEKDEKVEGDAALNKLFQQIYAGADEDTRRAMNKSFVESNGTVLSTNWKEVGSKPVEGSAPSGMEMKKYEH